MEEGEPLVGQDAHAEAVLHLPTQAHTDEALVDVGGDVGMNVQHEGAYVQLVDQLVNFLFEHVSEEEAGLDGAFAHAGGACLVDVYLHDGSCALPRDLHESELAQW